MITATTSITAAIEDKHSVNRVFMLFLESSHQKTSHQLTFESLKSSAVLDIRSRWNALHNSNALGNAFNQPDTHTHFPETAGYSAHINITSE